MRWLDGYDLSFNESQITMVFTSNLWAKPDDGDSPLKSLYWKVFIEDCSLKSIGELNIKMAELEVSLPRRKLRTNARMKRFQYLQDLDQIIW